jgi:DNA (cytosine-5)-methyltransferase 1
MALKHGSLFSGIGGFDLASEWMGWENVFHCEWMEFPRKVLDYYWPNADSHIDICKTDFTKYANRIDILTGGFPCQPFSMAGKRKGTNDERYLWGEMLRAIQEIKPKYVIAENVFGLTNIDGGLVFEQVCLDLEAEGYEVQPFIIPAAAKNAPHRRDRCWFVAYSKCNGNRTREGIQCERGMDMDRVILEERKRIKKANGFIINNNDENATNTNSNGLNQCNSNDEVNTSERRINAQRNFEQSIVNGNVTDTESQPGEWMRPELRKFSQQEQRESGGTHSQMGNNATYTDGIRLRGESNRVGKSRFTNEAGEIGNWQNFPTQSPICSGDDGISTELDGITFSKWRAESIKGYGNAIVPQVAFELFKQLEL